MTTLAIGLGMARHRISVLVVEDSLDHRVLMERRLREAGMEVRVAGDADEAMRQVDDVDLVLLDHRLPAVSGLDVLRWVRERESAPAVVMVTGMGSTDVAVEAMRAGAIDYLAKNPVRAMGGEVGVSSQPGAGSTFWFTVPLVGESPDVAADDRQGSRRE